MQKKADSISREKLLDMLRTVASHLGVTRLTLDEFDMYSGLARSVIYKHFDGWKDACQAAELTSGLTLAERPTPQTHTDDDWVRELQRVARLLKTASLSRSSFSQYALISASTVSRRFGNWNAALGAAGLCPTALAGLEKQPTCDDCVGEVQRVAALLDQKHLTREEFRKHTIENYITT
jgi:Homing endonuclease associated repeat